MHIGFAIKKIREEKGLKQKDLAARLKGQKGEYDAGNLSKIEKGKQGYSSDFLSQLPGALGVPLSKIFEEAERKTNKNRANSDANEQDLRVFHALAESYQRLAQIVQIWPYLTDATQSNILERVEEILEAARHGLKPPAIKIKTLQNKKSDARR